jgi:hypothetical protein
MIESWSVNKEHNLFILQIAIYWWQFVFKARGDLWRTCDLRKKINHILTLNFFVLGDEQLASHVRLKLVVGWMDGQISHNKLFSITWYIQQRSPVSCTHGSKH